MKSNSNMIFIVIVGIIILIALLTFNQQKKLDWRSTYTQEDKIPYGTYLLYQRLPDLFNGEIKISKQPLDEVLPKIQDSTDRSNFIIINKHFYPDSLELNALSNYIKSGNDAFIAVNDVSDNFAKEFKIDIDYSFHNLRDADTLPTHFQLNFYDAALHQSEDYRYELKNVGYRYFLDDSIHIPKKKEIAEEDAFYTDDYFEEEELDSITQDSINNLPEDQFNKYWEDYDDDEKYIFFDFEEQNIKLFERTDVQAIGYDHDSRVNFIRLDHGDGHLYLHTSPICFTNYHLLNEPNDEYIATSLSFLPKEQIVYWDENYKYWHRPSYGSSGYGRGKGPVKSPFSYIMSQPALKWALMIFIAAILLFMIFEAKRRQRIIPVINPPQNASLDFAETMGRLYYNNYDHKDIINKKIRYFFDYVRTKFYMKTIYYTPAFYQDLSRKSGVPQEKVTLLFKLIERLESHEGRIADSDLLRLNRHLEAFYEKAEKR